MGLVVPTLGSAADQLLAGPGDHTRWVLLLSVEKHLLLVLIRDGHVHTVTLRLRRVLIVEGLDLGDVVVFDRCGLLAGIRLCRGDRQAPAVGTGDLVGA